MTLDSLFASGKHIPVMTFLRLNKQEILDWPSVRLVFEIEACRLAAERITSGGFGKMMGLVLSLIVLQVISSGLNLLGVGTHLTIALWGAILILVISLHHFRSWFRKSPAV